MVLKLFFFSYDYCSCFDVCFPFRQSVCPCVCSSIHLFVFLFVYLSISLCIHSSVCLLVCLSLQFAFVFLFVCLSIPSLTRSDCIYFRSVPLSLYPFSCLCIRSSICPSLCLSIHPFLSSAIYLFSVWPFLFLSIHLPVYLFIRLSFSLPGHLSSLFFLSLALPFYKTSKAVWLVSFIKVKN
jgi:hypothetical protein